MATTRQKEQLTQMERALIAAKLSAHAYKTENKHKQLQRKWDFRGVN